MRKELFDGHGEALCSLGIHLKGEARRVDPEGSVFREPASRIRSALVNQIGPQPLDILTALRRCRRVGDDKIDAVDITSTSFGLPRAVLQPFARLEPDATGFYQHHAACGQQFYIKAGMRRRTVAPRKVNWQLGCRCLLSGGEGGLGMNRTRGSQRKGCAAREQRKL